MASIMSKMSWAVISSSCFTRKDIPIDSLICYYCEYKYRNWKDTHIAEITASVIIIMGASLRI